MSNSQAQTHFLQECVIYVSRVNQFDKRDWYVYIAWIGLMCGLFASVSLFFWAGVRAGVEFPIYAWDIPIGTAIFVVAIAFDTIGHRTIYKEVLAKGEALVHHLTIFAGITSVLGLCLAYQHREIFRVPTLVMIGLSVIYSLIDEAMHWHRYLTHNSDRVEMWSHFFILFGHMVMIVSWWVWFEAGYPGVAQTVRALQL